MAHRERLMTKEDVLEELELGDENEPMIARSDDEFSDANEGNDNNDDNVSISASAS